MSATALIVLALLLAGGLLAHYATTVRAVRVARRPLVHQAGIAVAALLAIGALAKGPGLLLGAIAVLLVLLAPIFLFFTGASALPPGRIAVHVGGPALDFSTIDAAGRSFDFSSLRGQRILLKFFRGHW